MKIRISPELLLLFTVALFGALGQSTRANAQSRAYIANQFGSGSLKIVELAGNTLVDSIPMSGVPNEVVVSPDGSRAYVSLGTNNVAVVDTAAKNVVAMIPTGSNPFGIAIQPDGSRVFVTNVFSNTVQVIDTASNSVIATIPVGTFPIGVALSPDGGRAYVTNHVSNSISVIDTATNLVNSTISLSTTGTCGVNGPWTITVAPNGERALATNINAGCVTYVDLVNQNVIAKISIGGSPDSADISPDGLSAYVAVEHTGSVAVIDLVTLAVSATIPEGISPWGIVLSSDGSRAYVANYNSGFTVIDTSTRTVIANIPMSQGTAHIALWEGPADSTPPSIEPTLSGTLGSNGWYTSDVEVTWSINDDESNVESSSGCSDESVISDTTGVTFTCSATSGGGTSSESVTIKRDATAPTISVSSPTSSNYLLNQAVAVNFACADNLSGVASCSGSIANGGNLDTSTAGSKTFTANTTDNAGNPATTIVVNYTVGYVVQALFDTTKAHKSGSTVPIKVRLVDASGNNVSSSSIALHALSVIQVSSQASTVLDDAGNSNPDYDFRYEAATSSYIFNLKTTGYSTGSYMLYFSAGGSSIPYSVVFQVRS